MPPLASSLLKLRRVHGKYLHLSKRPFFDKNGERNVAKNIGKFDVLKSRAKRANGSPYTFRGVFRALARRHFIFRP